LFIQNKKKKRNANVIKTLLTNERELFPKSVETYKVLELHQSTNCKKQKKKKQT